MKTSSALEVTERVLTAVEITEGSVWLFPRFYIGNRYQDGGGCADNVEDNRVCILGLYSSCIGLLITEPYVLWIFVEKCKDLTLSVLHDLGWVKLM